MPLIVIYNPVCGPQEAKAFTSDHILPLLAQHSVTVDVVLETEYAGHAGAFVAGYKSAEDLTVVLASGDGTLHEIVNQCYMSDHGRRISFVLVPEGTANALYSSLYPSNKSLSAVEYKLQSLQTYLNTKAQAHGDVPLILSVTTFFPAPGTLSQNPKSVISVVVASTALHASILYDSEKMRKEIPGLERFKVAAQRNGNRWYNATAKLLPSGSGAVQVYDPSTQQFDNHPDSTKEHPTVELKGPFIYFLSTVNVDRLESDFRISPLARRLPSDWPTYDIVVVRPLRDPSLRGDDEGDKAQYVDKIWQVMRGAYADGSHVDLRYDEKGQIVSAGHGPSVVEYVRCGGWEWIPDDNDERASMVCSDGDILIIESGGKAVSVAQMLSRFAVYG